MSKAITIWRRFWSSNNHNSPSPSQPLHLHQRNVVRLGPLHGPHLQAGHASSSPLNRHTAGRITAPLTRRLCHAPCRINTISTAMSIKYREITCGKVIIFEAATADLFPPSQRLPSGFAGLHQSPSPTRSCASPTRRRFSAPHRPVASS